MARFLFVFFISVVVVFMICLYLVPFSLQQRKMRDEEQTKKTKCRESNETVISHQQSAFVTVLQLLRAIALFFGWFSFFTRSHMHSSQGESDGSRFFIHKIENAKRNVNELVLAVCFAE